MGLKRQAKRDETEMAAVEPKMKWGMQCGLKPDRAWKIEWDGNRMDYDGRRNGKENANKYLTPCGIKKSICDVCSMRNGMEWNISEGKHSRK